MRMGEAGRGPDARCRATRLYVGPGGIGKSAMSWTDEPGLSRSVQNSPVWEALGPSGGGPKAHANATQRAMTSLFASCSSLRTAFPPSTTPFGARTLDSDFIRQRGSQFYKHVRGLLTA
jgi:hypothetical protein